MLEREETKLAAVAVVFVAGILLAIVYGSAQVQTIVGVASVALLFLIPLIYEARGGGSSGS
jgi:hypothetical protein